MIIRELIAGAKAFISRVGGNLLALAKNSSGFALYAFLLFLTMTAAYNLQIWRLGFYYDDWEGAFLQKQLFSAGQIWDYFLRDRPFSSLTHLFFNPIIGTRPIGWRLLGQTLNWVAILLFVKTLLGIWPKRVMEIGWIGLLLAVYPGITRQFVVRTSIPHYTSMLLFILSLWLMVQAVLHCNPKQRPFLIGISVLLGTLQMLIIEFFAGMELIRWLLLFTIFRREGLTVLRAARKAFSLWLPYALGFIIFLVYHLGILPRIQLPGSNIKLQPVFFTQFLENPVSTIIQYTQIVLQDLVYAVVYVWSQVIVPGDIVLQSRAVLLSWLVGIVVAALGAIGVYLWHRKAVSAEEKEPYLFLIFLICIAALLLGGLPVWVIGQQGTKGIWASRFLFGPVLGAVPLIVLLVTWITSQPRRRAQSILLAVFLTGALSMQVRTGNKYALNWDIQRDYYWQLKWRAPVLKPGTFILSPYTPFTYNDGYQIAYAVNILYAPGNSQANTRYWWFDGPDQNMVDIANRLYPLSQKIEHKFRSITFQSDMQHALGVFFRPARGCLQVVSQAYQHQPGLLREESDLYTVLNDGLVSEGDLNVPLDIFGPEPRHDWCYYFQKADLAREMKHWDQAYALWEEASALGLKPAHLPEYLPFIESSMQTGHWEQAMQITQAANEGNDMAPFLCATWSRVKETLPDSQVKKDSWDAIKAQLECMNPGR